MGSQIGLRSSVLPACTHIVPVSMRSFALRKAKKEVETENTRLRANKTMPVFEDGEWETPAAPHMPATKSKSEGKGKEKKRKGRGSSQLLRPSHDRKGCQC